MGEHKQNPREERAGQDNQLTVNSEGLSGVMVPGGDGGGCPRSRGFLETGLGPKGRICGTQVLIPQSHSDPGDGRSAYP